MSTVAAATLPLCNAPATAYESSDDNDSYYLGSPRGSEQASPPSGGWEDARAAAAPEAHEEVVRGALRKGKWTPEEELFTSKIISAFTLGHLPIPAGTTLRSYLSEKLHCDPMRITKKFAGAACIGKRVYQQCERTPENLVAMRKSQKELADMEARFMGRADAPPARTMRKPASPRVRTAPTRGGGSVGAPQERSRSASPDAGDRDGAGAAAAAAAATRRASHSNEFKRSAGGSGQSIVVPAAAGGCAQCNGSDGGGGACSCGVGPTPMDLALATSREAEQKPRADTWPNAVAGTRSLGPRLPPGGPWTASGSGGSSGGVVGKPPRQFARIPELSAISDADAGGLLLGFFRSVHAKHGSEEEVPEAEALAKLHPLVAAKGGSVSTPALSAYHRSEDRLGPFSERGQPTPRPPKRQKSLECMLNYAVSMEQH